MLRSLRTYLDGKRGHGLVEYVLLVALIALVLAMALAPLTTAIKHVFTKHATTISDTGGGRGSMR